MKITKSKTITETHTYHISDTLTYIKIFKNGKETLRHLACKIKIKGYETSLLYEKDLSVLKIHNPFWGDGDGSALAKSRGYAWLQNERLPEPEQIDIKKIILASSYDHSFYDLNKDPVPVVIHGDYIGAHLNDYWYDLPELKKHLEQHKAVVKCSEILDVPYYNEGDTSGHHYLDVLVYPTKKILKYGIENKLRNDDLIFYTPWEPKCPDFLKIKKFAIRKSYNQ